MVRVRGWIERRNGPYVELTDPRQIEVLEEAKRRTPARMSTDVAAPE